MVAIAENTVDTRRNFQTAMVHHKPAIDLFWFYARAATSRDPDELRDLACSDCDPIRRRVARNPATPCDALAWLSVDWHPPVREGEGNTRQALETAEGAAVFAHPGHQQQRACKSA